VRSLFLGSKNKIVGGWLVKYNLPNLKILQANWNVRKESSKKSPSLIMDDSDHLEDSVSDSDDYEEGWNDD